MRVSARNSQFSAKLWQQIMEFAEKEHRRGRGRLTVEMENHHKAARGIASPALRKERRFLSSRSHKVKHAARKREKNKRSRAATV